MKKADIHNNLSALVPNRAEDINDCIFGSREQALSKKTAEIAQRVTAKELAAAKRKEQKALDKEIQRAEELEAHGIPDGHEALRAQQRAKIEEIEALEAENVTDEFIREHTAPRSLARTRKPLRGMVDLQSTTPTEVQALLANLGVNLNLHLTKNDTANLLSCLLTCNEQQLLGLMDNSKVPIAIKTVIKRLLDDASKGNMSTVEKLWDRVFGKTAMVETAAVPDGSMPGLIPNKPVSREAYIVIRDTIIN